LGGAERQSEGGTLYPLLNPFSQREKSRFSKKIGEVAIAILEGGKKERKFLET